MCTHVCVRVGRAGGTRVGLEENQKEGGTERGERRVSKALKVARLQQSGTVGGKCFNICRSLHV